MPQILEMIIITSDPDGTPHIAPLGLISQADCWIVAPYRSSKTLANLYTRPRFVANLTDDARYFAGCLTGRRAWPLLPSCLDFPPRLGGALAHWELEVEAVNDQAERPRFLCRIKRQASHAPFTGHNRAFAAVVEASVLVSRIHILPLADVISDFSRLRGIVSKTAGRREEEAFKWLADKVAQ